MLHLIKYKNITRTRLVVVFLLLLVSLMLTSVASPTITHAAPSPPRCDSGAGPGGCPSPPGYNVDGQTFQNDHCYKLVPFGNTLVWQDVGCTGVFAPYSVKCDDGTTVTYSGTTTPDQACTNNGGYTAPPTANPLPDSTGDASCTLNGGESPDSCTIFTRYLFPIIDFLAAGVGIVVTIMVVVGGIQYSSARGDPNATAAAKRRITNALLGLVSFGLLWAFVQWIVPGGVL